MDVELIRNVIYAEAQQSGQSAVVVRDRIITAIAGIQGPAGTMPRFRGIFSLETNYLEGDLALNEEGSVVYRAIQNTLGNALTNNDYWEIFVSGDKHYSLTVSEAVADVTVTHNLNKVPAVGLTTLDGDPLEADVSPIDLNNVRVRVSPAMGFIIYCN